MRVVDAEGNIKVVTDDVILTTPAQTSAFGELLAVAPKPRAGWNNSIVNHPDLVRSTVTANATITNSGGMAVVAVSGGTGAASAVLDTYHTLRYLPGIGGLARFTATWPLGGAANVTQFIGPLNTSDGFAFGYNGTTFGVLRRVGGVDNFVAQASWSETLPDGFTPDLTKLNVFQIRYQWLGGGMIEFYMENPATGEFVLVHKIEFANTSTTPSINNPVLPMAAIVARASGTNAGQIKTPSAMTFTEGDQHNALRTRNALHVSKGSVTTEAVVMMIRDKASVFGGSANNRSPIEPDFLSLATDGAKSVVFRIYKNGTLSGGSWSDVSTTRSIAEQNTTATISGGVLLFSIPLSKVDTVAIDLHELDLNLDVGESITITASSAASNDVEVGLSWEELY